MQETTLIKLSLIIIFIGMPVLSFTALSNENLNPSNEIAQDEVTIVGTLTKLQHTKSTTRLTINYNTNLNAVAFEKVDIPINKTVTATGSIKDKELLIESLSYS